MNGNSFLKLCDLIGIYFLLPILLITIELIYRHVRNRSINLSEVCIRWLHFSVMTCGSFSAGIMQTLCPQFTASMLQLPEEAYIIIQELGYAAIGIGVVNVLALKFPKWRAPGSLARGIFILLCTINHFTRTMTMNLSEILAVIVDVWIIVIAVYILIKDRKHKI